MPTFNQCRLCGASITRTFVDLGMSPLCESFLRADQLNQMEPFYPLRAWVCEACFLVQLEQYVTGEDIFTDYAYFSSFSDSWLKHCERYVHQMIDQLRLTKDSQVIEIASNDGYLLQYFVARGIPALGVEPARNVAAAAVRRGVTTITEMFGRRPAQALVLAGRRADLLIGLRRPDLVVLVVGIERRLRGAARSQRERRHGEEERGRFRHVWPLAGLRRGLKVA